MKKRMGKVLSGLIILTMIISSTGFAFAGEKVLDDSASQKSIKLTTKQNSDVEKNLEKKLETNRMSRMGESLGNSTVPVWKTGKESVLNELVENNIVSISYSMSNNTLGGNSNKYGASATAYLPKGTVLIYAIADGDGQYAADAHLGVFKDENMSSPVDGSINVIEDQDMVVGTFNIPSSGTYQIGAFSYKNANDAENISVVFSAVAISGLDRTIYSGSQIAVGQKKAQTNYFTFKAAKTGYIRILTDSPVKFKLYNSNKSKSLSDTSSSTTEIVYGVKKGTTYKVKVQAPDNKVGVYLLELKNIGISENSGSSKSKAKTISRGASKGKSGCIIAGSSTADWYKFKLTKKNTIKVTLKGATNNGIKLYVYKGSKLLDSYTLKSNYKSIYIKSKGKVPTGTYYIKIARANSYSSGWYKCYWDYK